MTYARIVPVEFNHCDPAGIVFFPRYFEMVNSVVENFFAEVLDLPFAEIVTSGNGVPTARIETDFSAPSRLGERLTFVLSVERLGRASLVLRTEARAGGEVRMATRQTLVWVAGGRPAAWPPRLREKITAFQEARNAKPA